MRTDVCFSTKKLTVLIMSQSCLLWQRKCFLDKVWLLTEEHKSVSARKKLKLPSPDSQFLEDK